MLSCFQSIHAVISGTPGPEGERCEVVRLVAHGQTVKFSDNRIQEFGPRMDPTAAIPI